MSRRHFINSFDVFNIKGLTVIAFYLFITEGLICPLSGSLEKRVTRPVKINLLSEKGPYTPCAQWTIQNQIFCIICHRCSVVLWGALYFNKPDPVMFLVLHLYSP